MQSYYTPPKTAVAEPVDRRTPWTIHLSAMLVVAQVFVLLRRFGLPGWPSVVSDWMFLVPAIGALTSAVAVLALAIFASSNLLRYTCIFVILMNIGWRVLVEGWPLFYAPLFVQLSNLIELLIIFLLVLPPSRNWCLGLLPDPIRK